MASGNAERLGRVLRLFDAHGEAYALQPELAGSLSASGIAVAAPTIVPGQLPPQTRLAISLGGDGSMLNALTVVRDSGVPVLGVNTGRLGFLSELSPERLLEIARLLLAGDFDVVERNVLEISSPDIDIPIFAYALNEFSVRKSDRGTLVKITAAVDGEFLNAYWADGLIVSTATGSTAYSLSAGGPVLLPQSRSLVVLPIASHNLTVRPVVLESDSRVELRVEGRGGDHIAMADNRFFEFPSATRFVITSAPFTFRTVRLADNSFFKTLREKLLWGADTRN